MLQTLKHLWTRFNTALINEERAYQCGVKEGMKIGRQLAEVDYRPIMDEMRRLASHCAEMEFDIRVARALLEAFKGEKPR